jgi:hypothetical protein
VAAASATTPVTMASADTTGSSSPVDTTFRSLFQFGERSQPVSPAVHKLWGESSSPTSVVASATQVVTPVTSASTSQGLDLFSDRAGTFSS